MGGVGVCNSQVWGCFQMLLAQLGAAHPGLQAGFAFNSAVFLLGIKVLLSGLSPTGVAHAWFLGGSVFAAFGWSGYLLVCLYFLIGTAATKIKFKEKDAAGIAEKGNGRRGPVRLYSLSSWALGFPRLPSATAHQHTIIWTGPCMIPVPIVS